LEWVVKEAENEMARLESLAEAILEKEGPDSPILMDMYDVSKTSCHDEKYPLTKSQAY
jgi:ATP-binding cassette subfamily F protein 2